MSLYRARFGDDYFGFWVGGCRFLVLNTVAYWHPEAIGDALKEQDSWLRRELADAKAASAQHIVLFSHVAPFLYYPDEPEAYFNIAPARRADLVALALGAGVTHWFCGHFHRNAIGRAGALEIVTSSAVGATITPSDEDPLGLRGIKSINLDSAAAGLRIVRVERAAIRHRWVTLDNCPAVADLTLPE